jgi:CDP-glycerol glycerophosphotransferase (TagB/SpsB family)
MVIARLFELLRGRLAKRWVRPLFRMACGAFMYVVPPRRQCAVFAWPDREGNGVEVLRYLADHYEGRIYWLRSDPDADLSWLFEPPQFARIESVDRSSLTALRGFLRAEAVFFTHGAFDRPRFGTKRTFVNLWHGDGPKSMVADPSARHDMPASVVIAGTRLFGDDKARHFRMSESAVLVTGNPRVDQFDRPATDRDLRALDLDPEKPIVCWAPTYRASSGATAVDWTDGAPLTQDSARLADLAQVAQATDVQLAVKPHPLDVDQYRQLGIHVLLDSTLDAARVGLYSLLARCDALITDYSSIWTDFLVLDRPIGLFCPDLDLYVATRGLNIPDYAAVAPGPFLATKHDFEVFLRSVVERADPAGSTRAASIRALGANTSVGATRRLVDGIEALRASRGLHPLLLTNSTRP